MKTFITATLFLFDASVWTLVYYDALQLHLVLKGH
jgi:hypothetical protein